MDSGGGSVLRTRFYAILRTRLKTNVSEFHRPRRSVVHDGYDPTPHDCLWRLLGVTRRGASATGALAIPGRYNVLGASTGLVIVYVLWLDDGRVTWRWGLIVNVSFLSWAVWIDADIMEGEQRWHADYVLLLLLLLLLLIIGQVTG